MGGDEFTAILEGDDYMRQDELLASFEKQVLTNLQANGTVVAFGCARFVPRQDSSISMVFERADAAMYQEKDLLKHLNSEGDEGEDNVADAYQARDLEDISVISVRRHILIADDMEVSRGILGDLLADDYDVYFATDGVECLEMLRNHKNEIAVLLLDLYMPNMSGREVIAQMQVDEDLMSIPVIVLSVDEQAELDSLRIGAMDFIPKPYPDIEIVKARIAKCIELSEDRDLIRHTERDKLTGLLNRDYFFRYVSRLDHIYKDTTLDAVVCDVNRFYAINQQYGRQFGDRLLSAIGAALRKLARQTGGIGCRQGGDTFLLYCPHQQDYASLLRQFTADVFADKEMADRVSLRFGVFVNAKREPDPEERFARASAAAERIKDDPDTVCGYDGET